MLFGVEARNEVFQIQVNFDLMEHGVPSAIFLCLDKPEFAPQMISGFPRSLLSHDPSSRRCPRLRRRVLQVQVQLLTLVLLTATPSETHLALYNSNSKVVPLPTTPTKSADSEFGPSTMWGSPTWDR